MERTIFLHISANKVWTQLRRLVIGLSPWMPRFDHGPVHVRFSVDEVISKEAFIGVLRSSVSIIPAKLHNHLLHTIKYILSGRQAGDSCKSVNTTVNLHYI